MKAPLPIANGFYVSASLPLSAQQCVNWYPNIPQAPALAKEVLFGTPGLTEAATAGNANYANRGGHRFEEKAYFVQGTTLYRLNDDGDGTYSLTSLGTIEGTKRVSMADNGTQMMILVPGGKGYIFTEDPDSLVEIVDGDFTANGNPQFVQFIDGYFVCTTDQKKFIISALNDGTSWNPLDVGTAEADPDKVVAPVILKNQLFIAGSSTMEGFSNQGGADFPFRRTGLFLSQGVIAPYSLITANGTIWFIGGGEGEPPAVWRLAGNDVEKVSTTAIDAELQKYTETELQDAFAWHYSQKGAYFVGFTMPDTTFVYDGVSGRWHERQSRIENPDGTIDNTRWRGNCIVPAYGELFVGDSEDGRIGKLSTDVYDEYDEPIRRIIATQPFQNQQASFFVPEVELTIESGMGNSDVEDPQMTMDRSLDGKTWTAARMRSMGKIGEYNRRVIWRRNGLAERLEVFRFTLSDPVKPVILQLSANILPGTK